MDESRMPMGTVALLCEIVGRRESQGAEGGWRRVDMCGSRMSDALVRGDIALCTGVGDVEGCGSG
jgi:hypothetical protein